MNHPGGHGPTRSHSTSSGATNANDGVEAGEVEALEVAVRVGVVVGVVRVEVLELAAGAVPVDRCAAAGAGAVLIDRCSATGAGAVLVDRCSATVAARCTDLVLCRGVVLGKDPEPCKGVVLGKYLGLCAGAVLGEDLELCAGAVLGEDLEV